VFELQLLSGISSACLEEDVLSCATEKRHTRSLGRISKFGLCTQSRTIDLHCVFLSCGEMAETRRRILAYEPLGSWQALNGIKGRSVYSKKEGIARLTNAYSGMRFPNAESLSFCRLFVLLMVAARNHLPGNCRRADAFVHQSYTASCSYSSSGPWYSCTLAAHFDTVLVMHIFGIPVWHLMELCICSDRFRTIQSCSLRR
jgi:hypothetical protein